ncbi:ABC transporter ATP-binding protein [Paenibacillus beijingensis]|uniref:Multidrug ABC transporter ATPase n=1 Tax=Paenibacillus beijingensis TaxID=1126833 RepID=A0A0D5NFN6_9BACL|nr:ABC transporter ATP-binding protein [Paenibacillus beijingensis]AJY74081.1 multidrug ABC transporter ATPase [Paenibacillus beijingensis]
MSGDAFIVKSDHIVKTYRGKRVLSDVTLRIPENSITAVLGPNGAGKSTLLRIIVGMVQPEAGSIEVLGQKPGWALNRHIAYLPDRASWYPHHDVTQAVEWGHMMLPGFNADWAWELLEQMNLEPSMPVAGMSKGQEARLMLALCMARDVPLIVLDEPFSGIDLLSREKIIAVLIDSLAERGQSVIMNTHEIVETESLFDYAVFLDSGQVMLASEVERLRQERGSVENVYRELYR